MTYTTLPAISTRVLSFIVICGACLALIVMCAVACIPVAVTNIDSNSQVEPLGLPGREGNAGKDAQQCQIPQLKYNRVLPTDVPIEVWSSDTYVRFDGSFTCSVTGASATISVGTLSIPLKSTVGLGYATCQLTASSATTSAIATLKIVGNDMCAIITTSQISNTSVVTIFGSALMPIYYGAPVKPLTSTIDPLTRSAITDARLTSTSSARNSFGVLTSATVDDNSEGASVVESSSTLLAH